MKNISLFILSFVFLVSCGGGLESQSMNQEHLDPYQNQVEYSGGDDSSNTTPTPEPLPEDPEPSVKTTVLDNHQVTLRAYPGYLLGTLSTTLGKDTAMSVTLNTDLLNPYAYSRVAPINVQMVVDIPDATDIGWIKVLDKETESINYAFHQWSCFSGRCLIGMKAEMLNVEQTCVNIGYNGANLYKLDNADLLLKMVKNNGDIYTANFKLEKSRCSYNVPEDILKDRDFVQILGRGIAAKIYANDEANLEIKSSQMGLIEEGPGLPFIGFGSEVIQKESKKLERISLVDAMNDTQLGSMNCSQNLGPTYCHVILPSSRLVSLECQEGTTAIKRGVYKLVKYYSDFTSKETTVTFPNLCSSASRSTASATGDANTTIFLWLINILAMLGIILMPTITTRKL